MKKNKRTLSLMTVLYFLLNYSFSARAATENTKELRLVGDGTIADAVMEITGQTVTLYLAKKPTNEPFSAAKLTLQTENPDLAQLEFKPRADPGTYEAEFAGVFPNEGELLIVAGEQTETLTMASATNLQSAGEDGKMSPGDSKANVNVNGFLLFGGGIIFGSLMIGLGLFLMRNSNATKAAAVILAIVAVQFFYCVSAFAHEDHDHGEPAVKETVHSGPDIFLVKKSQFLIGLKTVPVKKESIPEVMITYGHVIPKPQLDAFVVVPQSGYVIIPSDMILGSSVTKGQAIATIDALNQIRISAPISGQISEMTAVTGTRVEGGTKLFRITDTSTVWVDAELFSTDLSQLKDATDAVLVVDEKPEGVKARPLNIVTPISEETRTAKVFLEVDNSEHQIRVGSLAKVVFSLKSNTTGLAVPASAVLNRGGDKTVFVRTGPESFQSRLVTAHASSRPATVLITSGINAGDLIVVTGNYQLMLKAK